MVRGEKMTRNRNGSIEVLRILACILVIMAHIQLQPFMEDGSNTGRLVMSIIVADNVPLFFLITGFFAFNRIDTDETIYSVSKYKMKSFLRKILVPSVVSIIIVDAANVFWTTKGNISTLWYTIGMSIYSFFFQLGAKNHLWYIWAYAQFILLFPVLAFICQEKKEKCQIRHFILGSSILAAMICDVQYFLGKTELNISDFGVGYYFIYIMLGYELSEIVRKYYKRRLRLFVIGLGLYILSFAVKYYAQIVMYNRFAIEQNRFRWLQNSMGFGTAVGLFLMVYITFSIHNEKVGFSKLIRNISSQTFGVYLFHMLIIERTKNLSTKILSYNLNGESFGGLVGYYIEYGMVVLGITLLVSFLFNKIYGYFVNVFAVLHNKLFKKT